MWRLCIWQKPGIHFVKLTKKISKNKSPSQETFKLSTLLQPKSLPFPHKQEGFLFTQSLVVSGFPGRNQEKLLNLHLSWYNGEPDT